jgi:hypothetical protein
MAVYFVIEFTLGIRWHRRRQQRRERRESTATT